MVEDRYIFPGFNHNKKGLESLDVQLIFYEGKTIGDGSKQNVALDLLFSSNTENFRFSIYGGDVTLFSRFLEKNSYDINSLQCKVFFDEGNSKDIRGFFAKYPQE